MNQIYLYGSEVPDNIKSKKGVIRMHYSQYNTQKLQGNKDEECVTERTKNSAIDFLCNGVDRSSDIFIITDNAWKCVFDAPEVLRLENIVVFYDTKTKKFFLNEHSGWFSRYTLEDEFNMAFEFLENHQIMYGEYLKYRHERKFYFTNRIMENAKDVDEFLSLMNRNEEGLIPPTNRISFRIHNNIEVRFDKVAPIDMKIITDSGKEIPVKREGGSWEFYYEGVNDSDILTIELDSDMTKNMDNYKLKQGN